MVVEVRRTREFNAWLRELRDERAARRIVERIDRVAVGLLGDVRSLGQGVSELRVDYGPGYRIYFTRLGASIVILLCGGDKSSQDRDIVRAKASAASLRRPS